MEFGWKNKGANWFTFRWPRMTISPQIDFSGQKHETGLALSAQLIYKK
jgi:hypothetical protein